MFLQGGPGFEATRPTSPPSGWMKRALADFRVLLLDQRGTGRSTPVGAVIPGETAEDQAAYLSRFRADAIVGDCEWIRRELELQGNQFTDNSSGENIVVTSEGTAPFAVDPGSGSFQRANRAVRRIEATVNIREACPEGKSEDRDTGMAGCLS